MASLLLSLIVLVLIEAFGIEFSYRVSLMNLAGFEIWLPITIIGSYAYNPVIGFGLGMLIFTGAYLRRPYSLMSFFIMVLSLLLVVFLTKLFPISQNNFLISWMLLAGIYNLVSNGADLIISKDFLRTVQFVVFSMASSWIFFYFFGWRLFEFL